MQDYEDFLVEQKTVTNDNKELIDGISNLLNKEFPNNFHSVRVVKYIGKYAISVDFGLIKDNSQLTSGYRENDPGRHSWTISILGDGQYEARLSAGSLRTNPESGSHMAMGSIKTPWRKTKGDASRIIKAFERWSSRFKEIVKKNEADIYQRSSYTNDRYFRF